MYFEIYQGFTEKELIKEYRRLSKKYHPDMPGGSKEIFQKVSDEFEGLKKGILKAPKKTHKIESWKFYEFFTSDTNEINMKIPRQAFKDGATIFLSPKDWFKEYRVHIEPDTGAPQLHSFFYLGKKVFVHVREEN